MDLCIGKLEGRFVNCKVPAVNYYSSSCSVFVSCSSATDYIFSTLAQEIKMDGADTEVCRIICKRGHIHTVFLSFCVYFVSLYFLLLSKDSDVSVADPSDILKSMKVGH